MKKLEQKVLNEILLEITLAIGSEQDSDSMIRSVLSLWMRRLSCTVAAIVLDKQGVVSLEQIVPKYLGSLPVPDQIVQFLQQSRTVEYSPDLRGSKGEFIYCYPIFKEHIFIFYRQSELTREQYNDIYPVTQFFGRSIENALEKSLRQQAEAQLDQERKLLRTVLDNIPDAIYYKNLSLQKVLTNRADLINTGFEKEEDILNKTDREIYGPEFADDSEKNELRIIRTGEPIINKEEKIINRLGYEGWLETSKIPLKNNSGNIVGIVGIGRDITERKKIQQQVQRLSWVASQSTNGVIITDVSGKVEWINAGFTRLTGFTAEEMIGKRPGDVLQGPESDPEVVKVMHDALKQVIPFEVSLINYKKDGKPYHIKITCNPLYDESDNHIGFMAIESDVTEMVKNRQELIEARNQAIKAQEAEKKFLANMSHEIRTPLNAIIGMTALLTDTPLNNEQVEFVKNLDMSSKFLLSLISDTLDLAKIEAGKIEPRIEVFDLNELINGIVGQFALKASKKGVKLSAKFVNVPRYVEGDQLLLLQILNNLLSNAEKFTEQGTITVHISRSEKYNNSIQFSIADTGIGIADSDLDKLFKKFNQLGSGNQIFNKGSGLGLNITKEIVELLGGEIAVASKLGQGTTFTFCLPLPEGEKHQSIKEDNQKSMKPMVNSGKILIAEDNKMNQLYVTKLLDKYGVEYDLANNGLEAVEYSQINDYQLILMDIQMPIMDGYEAIQKIRKSGGENSEKPILALTASALVEIKDKAFRIGVTDFISKPFTPSQLKSTIEKYLELEA